MSYPPPPIPPSLLTPLPIPPLEVGSLAIPGQKCNKLLKFQVYINNTVLISDQFFRAFSEFKSIKQLTITLPENTVLFGSVECFKHCKQLKELYISYGKLREDFFANIASFVPKLQSLVILIGKKFSYSFITSFHSMRNIRRVELICKHSAEKSMKWYFGKSVSEVMLSPNGMNVKHITHNCGLIEHNN